MFRNLNWKSLSDQRGLACLGAGRSEAGDVSKSGEVAADTSEPSPQDNSQKRQEGLDFRRGLNAEKSGKGRRGACARRSVSRGFELFMKGRAGECPTRRRPY